jgi:hypothetical protein
MSFSPEFYDALADKLKNQYFVYKNSFHTKDDRLFFLCRKKTKKYFCEVSYKKDFVLGTFIENIIEEKLDDKNIYIGLFECSIENSKKIALTFDYLIPAKLNKNVSVGFGDRIGIATAAHVRIARKYDFFPLFTQQSVREITKTSRDCETVLHNAVTGIFQEGYTGNWGSDADHIRDKKWVEIMLNNTYLPYTMFTIDTYDYVNLETDVSYCSIDKDEKFKERLERSKKYIGKDFNLSGHKFRYDENNLYFIVKRYYRCLDFLLDCYNTIKEKNKEFDFEPTFDEREIETTPEEHFYLASELINDGIAFTTFAPKFPGIFEKGVDYEGNLDDFIYNLKIHNSITKYFGSYKLSIHSADDKFKIFKYLRDILGYNFHIKTSGTTWMESLRTVAEFNPELFNKIFEATFNRAQENSKDYYIQLDYEKINNLLKVGNLLDFIDISETRQLLHVSYGTVINEFREEILETLYCHEEEYFENIMSNYKKHLDAILT